MKKRIIYFCLVLSVVFGCQKPAGGADEIESDNGKKWLVNPETALHIEAMEADVANFKTGDDMAELQSRMKENITQLTAKCTMEGKSHDELHKWLVPFIETVNSMQETESKVVIRRLENQFGNYNYYFESNADAIK